MPPLHSPSMVLRGDTEAHKIRGGTGVSRTVIVGLVGAAILVIALFLNLWSNPDPAEVDATTPATQNEETTNTSETAAAQPTPEPEPEDVSEVDPPQQAALTPPEDPQPTEAPQDAPSPIAPTFDVVRIDPSGDAVIAGRAEPGSTVTVIDTGTDIGFVEADGRGEWVFLPTTPLEPGPHELRLRAELEDGTILFGEGAVVLVVPNPGQDIAGRDTDDSAADPQPVVVLIPDEDTVGAELIQAPKPAAPEPEIPDDTAPIAALGTTSTAEPSGVESDDGSMSVETIDYDPEGNISIAGTAPRDSTVIAYLDGNAIGSGDVNTDRKWRINPDTEVAPGIYQMRLDAVSGDTVVSRLEIPFSRAAPITDLEGDAFIVVQPGNSLWRIARRTLGDGVNFTVIYEANEDQIRDPDLIYPGQVFEIPR